MTGKAKDRTAPDPHVDDARLAVLELVDRLRRGTVDSDIRETEVLNIAAAGLVLAGLVDDVALLGAPCLVVRPPDRRAPRSTAEPE